MADSSVARGRIGGPDFFADDDPLAELARIAGYEEKVVAMPQTSPLVRREPSFNLEDELLREFEQYEEPRAEPVAPVAPEPLRAREPVLHGSPVEADPFADSEPEDSMSVSNWQVHREQPLAVDDPHVMPPAPVSVTGGKSDPDFGGLDDDLIAELETSLTAPAGSPMAGRTSPRGAYEPGFRMPLTNFVVAPPRTQSDSHDLSAGAGSAAEPPRDAVPSTWATDFAADVAAVRARPVPSSPKPQAVSVDPVFVSPPTIDVLSLQNELAQVFERSEERVEAARIEPLLSEEAAAPIACAVHAEPPLAPVSDRVEIQDRREAVVSEPAPDLMDDDFELMLDDLELDLADLMQDEKAAQHAEAANPALRPEPMGEAVVEPVAEPAPAACVPRTPPVATLAPEIPAFLAQSRLAPEVVKATPVIETTPVPPSIEVAAIAPDIADDDAFDPALLADAEEMPEAVPDLDVPEIPVHEPEKPVAPPSDFDLDLDSELATYLDTAGMSHRSVQAQAAAKPQERATSRASAGVVAPAAASVAATPSAAAAWPAAKTNDGLDDFERALEEDFRRSLATPLRPKPVDEAYADDDSAPVFETPRRSLAAFAMPLSIAGFVGIVGISAYAWYATGKATGGNDGSPVVIAADSEPVKVVPDNPGGKVVPNQDKAVYDRVASGSLNDPKQPSLISSEEHPVDVVQKTLTPENLPLEGEDEAQAEMTPVGETEDARLLPTNGQSAHAKPGDAEQLAVMPRRVKTMIVRPDGTLVEQVSDVPAAQPVKVATEKVPAAPALAEPKQLAANGPVTAGAPTNIADVNVARTTALTVAADAPASTASTGQSGVPAPNAPVPTARPSGQPVQVVAAVTSQGNVRNDLRPAQATATPVSAPVAAAAPMAQQAPVQQSGGYFIQIASLPTEADAQKSSRNLSSKFAGVIGGRSLDIAKADIAGKGTFYRVRVAAGNSRDEAAALCERYRAAGGTCLIAR